MSKNYYTLEVTTTQQCNMRCTYCFEGKELDNNNKAIDVEVIIGQVRELLTSKDFLEKHNGVCINFWGGEPTLNHDYCINLIHAFKDDNVDFFFYTNGYNYDNINRILNYASLYNIDSSRIRLQISFDGVWNDETRVTAGKKGTSDKVLDTFEKLSEKHKNINVSFKSTLPVEKLVNSRDAVVKNWEYFEALNLAFDNKISYNPTLEYTQFYELNDEQIDNMKHQFNCIAKKEIEFFKEYKRHLMSWFDVRNTQLCSAGMNIGNIDLEGNITMCHGALYTGSEKSNLIVGNILESKPISDTILNMKAKHFKILEDHIKNDSINPSECTNCDATVCYQCPTVNYTNNKNLSESEKYHTPKKDLCKVYQTFGKISNVLYTYLNTK